MNIQEFIDERIKENEKQFTNKELRRIKQNKELIKKIYLLAGMNVTNAFLGNAN